MTSAEMVRLAEQAEQARRDLEELSQQEAAGEIDADTASRLRAVYQAELEASEDALAAESALDPEEEQPTRSRSRVLAGTLAVVLVLAVAIGLAGRTATERDDGPLQGVAAGDEFDPSQYSNETMEAVIAGYADDPEVAGQLAFMRFALAERYFEAGDYQQAFPHYQEIIEGDPPPELAAPSLVRVAWIVWTGNQRPDLALTLLDRALELMPGHPEATYVKGQVLWCGQGMPAEAAPLFRELLEDASLDPQVRSQVEADLTAAEAGEACST